MTSCGVKTKLKSVKHHKKIKIMQKKYPQRDPFQITNTTQFRTRNLSDKPTNEYQPIVYWDIHS